MVQRCKFSIELKNFPPDLSGEPKLPSCFVGYKVSDLSLETEFNIKIIALIKGEKVLNGLGISILEHQVENHFEENYELEEEDQLVCYGLYKNFMDFWKAL